MRRMRSVMMVAALAVSGVGFAALAGSAEPSGSTKVVVYKSPT